MTRNSIIDRNPRGFAIVAGVGVALVGLPLVGLLARVDWSRFVSLLGDKTVRDALWLSLVTSVIATMIAAVCGVPLAWALARGSWRGRGLVRSLVLVPLVNINVPEGRALEVWTLPSRERGPVSVGLMNRARTLALSLKDLPAPGTDQLFEITLEPATGSPTGRPTGPVLFKGNTALAL